MGNVFQVFFNLLINQCAIFNVFSLAFVCKIYYIIFFSVGKKPTGVRNLIEEALHRERMVLKSKVKQIRELLLKPETQAKIRKELFEGRFIHSSSQEDDVDFRNPLL